MLTRRSFLASLASAVPLAIVVREAHAAAAAHLAADSSTLDALAEVVLPAGALGKAGVVRATKDFRDWEAGYREGAELNHGYGTSHLRNAGPTPLTRWARQLDELDATARRAHQKPFAALGVAQRESLVRSALAGPQRAERMPSVENAPHVALALLAHFYGSPLATDLCYEAHIGKETCRPLAAQARKPLPLAQERA